MTGSPFDAYSLKARWAPAMLAIVPVLVLMLSAFDVAALIGTLGPATASLVVGFVANEIVRGRGRRVERALVREWGGLPTTRELRATSDPSPERRRRRQQVEKMSNRELPALIEQSEAPAASDRIVDQAVRTVLVVLRHGESAGISLLHKENISYGFRRNLLALRPFGLAVSLTAFIFTLVLNLNEVLSWAVGAPIIAVQLIVTALWVFVAKRAWVLEQAETFSDRFFTVLDAVAAVDGSKV